MLLNNSDYDLKKLIHITNYYWVWSKTNPVEHLPFFMPLKYLTTAYANLWNSLNS